MFQEILPDQLWTAYSPGRILGVPMGRRMAVLREADGRLVIFSPIRPSEAAFAALRALGGAGRPATVAAFVVPNLWHDNYFGEWHAAFPEAELLGASAVVRQQRRWRMTVLRPGHVALAEFDWLTMGGMPAVQEQVFFHRPTATLILADLYFNLPGPWDPLTTLWLRASGINPAQPGPSNLERLAICDRAAFVASLRRVLDWPFVRLLPGHGEPTLTGDAHAFLRRAYAGWGL